MGKLSNGKDRTELEFVSGWAFLSLFDFFFSPSFMLGSTGLLWLCLAEAIGVP